MKGHIVHRVRMFDLHVILFIKYEPRTNCWHWKSYLSQGPINLSNWQAFFLLLWNYRKNSTYFIQDFNKQFGNNILKLLQESGLQRTIEFVGVA